MDLATALFPEDKDIRELIEEREAERKKSEASHARWTATMPKSIQPLWKWNMEGRSETDLKPLSQALAKEFTAASDRILALLAWFGSGDGPWSGYYAYEDVAEALLFDNSTADIVAAIQSTTCTKAQIEGAARFFGGWEFSQRKLKDLDALPSALKKTLLDHSLMSTDEDKRGRAAKAFGK